MTKKRVRLAVSEKDSGGLVPSDPSRPTPRDLSRGGPVTSIIACEIRLEEALTLLTVNLAKRPKRGKKPVLLHSLRVAWRLQAFGYDVDVVVAGLLHDALEKTTLSPTDLAQRFGIETTAMVKATTNDLRIKDSLARYLDSVSRCAFYGEGALLVRAADLIDNTDRQLLLGGPRRLSRVAQKLRMLIEVCREELIDPRMTKELERRSAAVARRMGKLALGTKKPQIDAKTARLSFDHKRRSAWTS